MVSDGDLEEVAETEMNMMLQRIPATCTVEFGVRNDELYIHRCNTILKLIARFWII